MKNNSENLFSAFEPVMSAIVNSPPTAYARGVKHDKNDVVEQKNTELSGSTVGAPARFASLSSTLRAVLLTSAYPQAESRSGPGGDGDPPPPGDKDDVDGDDGGEQRFPTAAELISIRRCVRVLVTDMMRNPDTSGRELKG